MSSSKPYSRHKTKLKVEEEDEKCFLFSRVRLFGTDAFDEAKLTILPWVQERTMESPLASVHMLGPEVARSARGLVLVVATTSLAVMILRFLVALVLD